MSVYHNPVLLSESVSNLITNPAGTYADATFGGGGHSREILRNLNSNGRLIGFDRDSDAEANAPQDSRFTCIAIQITEAERKQRITRCFFFCMMNRMRK